MEPKNDFTQSADNYGEVVGVSAGLGLCAALKRDGKIIGAGSCNYTFSCEDIVQVSAGGYHIAALKKDGTIVATGANSHIWSNISL